VLVIATHGDWRDLLHLAFNRGDAWMFLGSLCYAGYTLGLRSRPAADPLSLFTVFSIVATITSLPLLMLEIVQGRFFMPTLPGYLILLFVAICPSFLGQMLFMRGVELVGPARASLFYNMVPVLGALSAVALVGEPFGLYHALALALVVGGIMVAERVKPA
jgi:drug/metabolite transporter (DMT)-like permease